MKNMGLIEKINKASKRLALAGIASLVGCIGVEPGPLHPSSLLFDAYPRNQPKQETQNQSDTITFPKGKEPYLILEYEGLENDLPNYYNTYGKDRVIILKRDNLKDHNHVFSCNYWNDLNNNGKQNYPSEFIGVKDRFSSKEKINVWICYPPLREGRKFLFRLWNGNGEKTTEKEILSSAEFVGLELSDMKSGNYVAAFYMGDKLLNSTQFSVEKD